MQGTQMTSTLVLYDYPASPNSRKVRIVLAEKGLSFETRTIDISTGEQRSEEYLTVNPTGKVPALQHIQDGETVNVYDSTIIVEYLEDAFPEPTLFPATAAGRARARILEDWADNIFADPIGELFGQFVFTSERRRNSARIHQARMRAIELLKQLDAELSDGRSYLLGDYSIADAALTPNMAYADLFGVPFGELLPKTAEWFTRLKNRPSFHA